MAIEHLLPPSDMSSHWKKAEPSPAPAAPAKAARRPAPAPKAASAHVQTPATAAPRQAPNAAEQWRAQQQLRQTQAQLSQVDRTLLLTQQELAQSRQAQVAEGQDVADPSFWQRLDVVQKGRAINRLKEKLHDLELQRSELVSDLSKQVQAGTYSVSGAEILAGIMNEII